MKNTKLSSIRLLAASLVAFCVLSFSAAQGQDRHVRVINQSSFTLAKLYASNIGTNDWQEDILGWSVLAPGYYVNVNIDDGSGYCYFDLKAEFSNRQEVIRRNVNVCTIVSWTISDYWNTVN